MFGFACVGGAMVFAMQLCDGQSSIACGVIRDAAKVHWAFLGLMAWFFDKVRTMFESRSEIRRKLVQDEVTRKLVLALQKVRSEAVYAAVTDPRKDTKKMRKLRNRLIELAMKA